MRLKDVGTITNSFLIDVTGKHISLSSSIGNGIAIFSLHGIAKGGYYLEIVNESAKNFYSKIIVD